MYRVCQRLIDEGLFVPMTRENELMRNGILKRIQQGENIKDKPIFCVYRADAPFSHIFGSSGGECKNSELIQDKLYSWEAFNLARKLSARDKQQPPRSNPDLPPFELYRVCLMADWEKWIAMKDQISFGDLNL